MLRAIICTFQMVKEGLLRDYCSSGPREPEPLQKNNPRPAERKNQQFHFPPADCSSKTLRLKGQKSALRLQHPDSLRRTFLYITQTRCHVSYVLISSASVPTICWLEQSQNHLSDWKVETQSTVLYINERPDFCLRVNVLYWSYKTSFLSKHWIQA